ncbi:MAG: cation:proton antiporter [Ruminococcaceae bacterium]|nr:cation:proton antiporter [Oscillospiraceae bacterium]
MLDSLYGKIGESAPGAVIIISVALMIFFGFAATRITKRLRLPNVTAYIVAGIIVGPFCLDLIPGKIISGTDFLSDIALAFISFGVGEFFKLKKLRKNGAKVIIITLFEACLASALIFSVLYFALKMSFTLSLILAALASATAPASTIMTIRQTGSKGDFVESLLQVIALDNVVSLIAYSIAISVTLAVSATGGGFSAGVILMPIVKNIIALAVGALFGLTMKLLLSKRSNDNRLIISVGILFLFCGICAIMDVSPLLGCMMIGAVYINLSDDNKLFLQLSYFSPPLLLLFFVRSGMSFDLGALFGNSASVGIAPLWVVGLVYFFIRIIGKYAGAFLGSLTARKSKNVRNYLGLALIPQAGVAIGLAAMCARTLGGETGSLLQTIILASSVLYELVGPGCAKLSLYLSGSYSNKIEDIAPVETTTETGTKKSDVEILIERIQKIQTELPPHADSYQSEEEIAFTEAAEEHFNSVYNRPRRDTARRF